MTILSYQEALEWISNNPNATVSELQDLVSRTSSVVVGAKTTLLYSGRVDDIYSSDIANAISLDNSDIATINKTDISSLLKDSVFTRSLRIAVLNEGLNFEEIYEGVDSYGNRINSTSMWDIASTNFASNATGAVKTITPLADSTSVFAQSEIPALLNNPNITSIDGIPIDELLSDYDNGGGSGIVFNKVKEASGASYHTLEIGTLSDGKLSVGTEMFYEIHPDINGAPISPDAIDVRTGSKILKADSNWSPTNLLSKSTLTKLGVAGDILSLSFAVSQANAANDAGDVETANNIMIEWSIGFIGGVAGAAASVAVLIASIPVLAASAVVAGTIAITAGIIGGIFGEEAALYLYDKGKEMGIYSDESVQEFIEASKGFLDGLVSDIVTISDYLQSSLSTVLTTASIPARNIDPLTLDLDGDGVELISLENSEVFFDLDFVVDEEGGYVGDGVKENVGWVQGDDGLLVYDKDGNGQVDNILELFGKIDKTGTEELSEYDLNSDGVINSSDAIFSDLQVWQDFDSDGVVDSGELKSLAEHNVSSINLTGWVDVNEDVDGNTILSTGSYVKGDGTVGEYANLELDVDQTNSYSYEYTDPDGDLIGSYDLNVEALFLPFVRGYGNVKALPIAASEDAELLEMLKDLRDVDAKDYKYVTSKVEKNLFSDCEFDLKKSGVEIREYN